MTFFSEPETVAILELKGEIGKSLCFQNAKELIDQAFGIKNLRAVLLEISSPGGSTFETEQIAEYLKAKMYETNIPIVSFVMEQALSGGYWLACSSLEIYATGRLSMVGRDGDLWLAEEALRLGLIDGIQTSWDYIGQNFTEETE